MPPDRSPTEANLWEEGGERSEPLGFRRAPGRGSDSGWLSAIKYLRTEAVGRQGPHFWNTPLAPPPFFSSKQPYRGIVLNSTCLKRAI